MNGDLRGKNVEIIKRIKDIEEGLNIKNSSLDEIRK